MKMEKQYLVRQPATLQSMAIRNLAEWIASQEQKFVTPVLQLRRCHAPKSEYFISRQIGTIRNYVASKVPSMVTPPADIPLQGDAGKDEQVLSQQIEIIRNYLGKMPKKFHNMLLKEVIRAVTLIPRPGDVIGRMIETMFSENVTSLSLSYLSKNNIHRDLFYSKSYLLTGLTHLNLESHATEAQTIRFLKELHGLQYLTVTDVCTDNILKCLVDNCKLIDTLDLRRSNINNKSINKLIQLRQLKRVNLCNTAVSEKGIETLLKSCENIERIDTDVEVTEVLKHIVSKNAGKQFKLKSYFINSYGMTFEKMQFIVQTCPLLEDIYLTNLCEWRADYLTVLNYLHCLRDLTLMDYNFYEEHIYELLQVRGYNLLHLHLKYVRKTDGNDLMDIFEMCPNLQSLTINCNVEYLDDLDESNDSFTSEIEIPPLKDLTTLTLEDRKGYEFTDKQLVFLLSNCPNVVYLDVSKSYSVTDSIILQVLDRNPKQLMYLKELRIRDKLQKTLLLDRIIQHCESPLRIIEVSK